jgi:exosortase A-associated hydrolase 2
MNDPAMSATFEEFERHRTVVVRWTPPATTRANVVVVPAFGDEMNQTRRMIRLAAEALAGRGVATVVFDPLGTGDSSAEFDDASVERWLNDFGGMLARLRSKSDAPIVLFGCRLGVALAVELTHRSPDAAVALVGWAPVFQGRMQLSAYLRAAKIVQHRRPGKEPADARAEWSAGRSAFLGGYPISPTLAEQLERLDASTAPRVPAATLIDVRSPAAEGSTSPSQALQSRADAWRTQGVDTEVLAVEGTLFWNVPDLVDLPSLVEVTVDAVERHVEGRLR